MTTPEYDWAAAPLLDQANVGRYVWYSHGSSNSTPMRIMKIGRTNIHLRDNRSLRVSPSGNSADGKHGEWRTRALTNAARVEAHRRSDIEFKLRAAVVAGMSKYSNDQLIGALQALGVEVPK